MNYFKLMLIITSETIDCNLFNDKFLYIGYIKYNNSHVFEIFLKLREVNKLI